LFASLLDKLPLGGVFLGSMLLVLLASRIGGWFGGREFNRDDGQSKVQSAAAVAAALGLLAFMLAITFSITNSRFDERRHLVLKEANAIGTAYLRTDILNVAEKRRAQCLLTDYVANRLTFLSADNAQRFSLLRRQSEDMQDALWKIGISATERNPNPANALFLSALNELIDVHQERITIGVQYRMPRVFWATLYSLVCITMLLAGYDERVSGARRSYIISLPIAAAFSLVLTLVVVLDRPQYWVNPLPFYDIQSTLARYPITCE
jgi:hypothetical protein